MSTEHHHEQPGFIRRWVFSTDHKVIGIQYTVTALCFLFFGFCLMMMMRWQLANPLEEMPVIPGLLAAILGQEWAEIYMPGGVMTPDFYNSLGAMHGTIMIFLGVVPIVVGGFGNFVMPLQIGAPDMSFPKINMVSYWVYFVGGVIMLVSFFTPGGAANSGWTSYPPLADIAQPADPTLPFFFTGQTMWLVGMVCLITSSLLGSINFIVTILQLRANGLTMFRLPFFVWAQFVTAFLLLLAFPPLEAAGILQLMDRLVGTSFFLPEGLVVSGQIATVQQGVVAGGGSPLLWQHLFWFLAHPEVYVLILPGMGIIAEIVANNTRKPLWGYRAMVYSTVFLGFMSFVVWAHHMFMTGMGTTISAFFATTTMIISIPSVVILTALVISLYNGAIRFNVPMLFALAWMPMFAIGGLTGLPLGLPVSDIALHDTYYVIGHFHYVVAPGTIFAIFAGIYFWFPKVTGRTMNETLGKIHFYLSFIFINVLFMPMFFQGLGGMLRRGYDPTSYEFNAPLMSLVTTASWGAWLLGLAQIPFIINFLISILAGKKAAENPWEATTLEWLAPSPPPHGNFASVPVVYRDPYVYSVPGMSKDFFPQHAASAEA